MKTLHLDYESRSYLDINEVGLDRYVTDPSTQVILAAYAFGDGPVSLWEPHVSSMPKDLKDAFNDPSVTIWAWNSAFERAVTNWLLGIPVGIPRFRCAMAQARYLSLPGKLAECSKILGMADEGKFVSKTEEVYFNKFKKLSKKDAKTRISTYLINKFCMPVNMGGKETLFGITEPYYRDWDTDPDDWKLFGDYCKQDVVAERALLHRMKDFEMSESEWETYALDQKINDFGVNTDLPLVEGGSYVAESIKSELNKRLFEITKLENPNSVDQLLGWLEGQGYTFHGLGKPFVARALAGECDLTNESREVLTIRQQSSKTSASKLLGIKDQLSSDGRLRHQYSYYGASRTGRWSSGSGE